jgi:hypothetical protein
MTAKKSPYHARGRGLIGVEGGGTDGVAVTVHGEGRYLDGQSQHHGINLRRNVRCS